MYLLRDLTSITILSRFYNLQFQWWQKIQIKKYNFYYFVVFWGIFLIRNLNSGDKIMTKKLKRPELTLNGMSL